MPIVYEKQAVKTLAKMPVKTALQIKEKIAAFASRSGRPNLDIETLKGIEGGYRLRQGDWRALMIIDGTTLRVVAIKPRGDAYK